MKESLRRFIRKARRYRSDLTAILTITFILSIETPLGILRVNADDIASLIFQVSGTVVPLALTAAGLSSTFVIKIAAEMPDIFEDHADFPPHKRGRALKKRINELDEVLARAWWATMLVLASFLLSALTLLIPGDSFESGMVVIHFNLDTSLASLSLACMLVGTLSFLPMIRYSFRGKLLTNLLNSAESLLKEIPPTIGEMLKDARNLRRKHPKDSYIQTSSKLQEEYEGRSFPLPEKLGLEAKELFAPIEDSTSGLSEIKRGIDLSEWDQICLGILRLIEQEEAYQKQHGEQSIVWHNRRKGIETTTKTVTDKWLPDSLKKD